MGFVFYNEITETSFITYFFCMIMFMWIFKKAEKPMWAPLVPLYNIFVLFEITGLNPFLLFLLLVPFLNIVIAFLILFVLPVRLSRSFGHSILFGLGLIFFPVIFSAILAFSSCTYIGPDGKEKKSFFEEENEKKEDKVKTKEVPANVKVSTNTKLEKKKCPHCGVQLESGAKKCFLCGKALK